MAPAKTPPDVIAKLNQTINKVLQMPVVQTELKRYEGIVRMSGAKLEE
jgi:hypothetical protein